MRVAWIGLVVVVGCAGQAPPVKTVPRAELASQMCALVKPCVVVPVGAAAQCEKAVAAALPTMIDESAAKVSLDAFRAAQPASCGDDVVKAAVPLELPKSGDAAVVYSVVLAADGKISVDGAVLANDDAIVASANAAREKNRDLRAVIKADASVPHGTVVHVLDLLKQAGIQKIAFGVKPNSEK